MITFGFEIVVSVDPPRLVRRTPNQRSCAQLLEEEIQSNLESLDGVVRVAVQRQETARWPKCQRDFR